MAKKIELVIENGIVTGYSGESKKLVIEGDIKEIADSVFKNCEFLEEVYIKSQSFKTIGKKAFYGCKKLKVFEIDTLKGSIGDFAFENCPKLKSIIIPNGAIKIGENVFKGCKKLIFVSIPETVVVICDNLFDDKTKTIILGQKNSEAEKYAQNNFAVFKVDSENIRESLLEAQVVVKDTYKDFEIAEEKIRCYKSLLLYEEINEYFAKFESDFLKEIFNNLPNFVIGDTADDALGKKQKKDMSAFVVINSMVDKKILSLKTYYEKQGIFISDKEIASFSEKYINNFEKVVGLVKEVYDIARKSIEERNTILARELLDEAESKVTGLGYGVIGDSVTLAVHAVDEALEERRQRKKAYKEMEKQFEKGSKKISAEADVMYCSFLQEKGIDALEKVVFNFCDGFKDYLFTKLVAIKKMSKAVFSDYDLEKSNKILQKIAHNDVDKAYVIALALKEYPINMTAIELALTNQVVVTELLRLIDFMELYKYGGVIGAFKNNYTYIELCKFKEEYSSFLSGALKTYIDEIIEEKAQEIIREINSFDCDPMELDFETWEKLLSEYNIIYPENCERLKLTEEQISVEGGLELLSNAVRIEQKKKTERAVKEEKENKIIRIQAKIGDLRGDISRLYSQKVSTIGKGFGVCACIFVLLLFGAFSIALEFDFFCVIMIVISFLSFIGALSNWCDARSTNKEIDRKIRRKQAEISKLNEKLQTMS